MDPTALALVAAARDAVQVSSTAGDVLACSPAWLALVRDRGDHGCDAWLDLVPPADRDRLIARMAGLGPEDPGFRLPVRLTGPDGQLRWCTVSRLPVADAGQVLGWVTTVVPTSDRAVPGDVAWRERDVLAQAERIASVGAWDWHIESGALWWSDEVYRIFGLAPQQFPATYDGFLEHVHPEDREELQRRVAAAVAGHETYDLRHRVRRPDGTVRFVREQGTVSRGPDGEPIRMLGTVLDVTEDTLRDLEQNAALRSLSVSENRLRLLAENSSDFVALSDPAGVVRWVSDSVTRVLGWVPEEVVGSSGVDFVHPDDEALARQHGTPAMAGVAEEVRLRLRDSEGAYRWFSRMSRLVRDDPGHEWAFVSGFRDVQAEVAAEEAATAAQDAAESERARLRAAMDAMLDPHVLLEAVRDAEGRIVDFVQIAANRAADAHTRALGSTLVGRTILETTPGQAAAGLIQRYARVVETGVPLVADAVAYADEAVGGAVRLFDLRGVRVGDGLSLTFRDVTDRVGEAHALVASEARYRMLAENASDIVMQLDDRGRVAWISESVTALLGWRPEQLVGHDRNLAHPDDLDIAAAARRDAERGAEVRVQYRVQASDGAYRWMAMVSRPVQTPAGPSRVVTMRDIEAEMTARTALEHALEHDSLTGLPTREALRARLEAQLRRQSRGSRRHVGVLCVAVDSLGDVVSALGHGAGDLLLTGVVARLVGAVRGGDRVGRGSGNEFFVVLPDLASPADAAGVAEVLRRQVRGPLLVQDEILDPTVSVGIATGVATDDAERLLRDATLAMRQAKAQGRDREVFADPVLAVQARDRLTIEAGIRDGLRDGEFVAWYQPVVELASEAVCGYEALVRWQHPDGTVGPPSEFLPVAEATGLIVDIDRAVLADAIGYLSRLPEPLAMAVNTAAPSLSAPGFADDVEAQLERFGVAAHRLHLEVTETTLLSVSDPVVATLRRLAAAGVGWYVDDFGTGYSSISHLRDLPISGLKLDRRFTEDAVTSATSQKLAQGLAALAASLNLDTVAEGVETRAQAALLTGQGWRRAQGWLFGRPVPAPATGLARTRTAGRA